MHPDPHRATWLGSDRFLARAVVRPISRFLQVEAAGGILLLGAAGVALVWASSPWSGSYEALWHTDIAIGVGRHVLHEDLRHWVNDGLMAVFFFVLGVEIKGELVNGELQTRSRAAVPVAGALGGMVVPALLYLAINQGGGGAHGWGIPMATDVAFALGVLALLGSRVPDELKVLLLALAIVDDVGAILVIALFYSNDLSLGFLAVALAGLGAVVVLRRAQVRYLPAYALLAVVIWWATFESGIHATIAGVALGLLTPARPLLGEAEADQVADDLSSRGDVSMEAVRDASFRLQESVPMTERLLDALHPWTSYLIVPLFALANAGVAISGHRLVDAASSRVAIGVAVGLVAGKAIGVGGGIAIALRGGWGELPDAIRRVHLVGLSLAAGIGFTVAIFISGLAFSDQIRVDDAKLAILLASAVSAVAALLVLRAGSPDDPSP